MRQATQGGGQTKGKRHVGRDEEKQDKAGTGMEGMEVAQKLAHPVGWKGVPSEDASKQ